MTSRDLSAFFGGGALKYERIPSGKFPDGKTYTVPSPTGRVGLLLNQAAEAGFSIATGQGTAKARDLLDLDDDDERGLWQLVFSCTKECGKPPADDPDAPPVLCGSTFDQMIADDVDWTLVQRIGQDAFLCFGVNQEFADALNALDLTQHEGDDADQDAAGKAPAPANRAERRAAAKKPAKKAARRTAKKPSSAPKGGSSSSPASGDESTPSSQAPTPGSGDSDPQERRTA